jgi:glutaminase
MTTAEDLAAAPGRGGDAPIAAWLAEVMTRVAPIVGAGRLPGEIPALAAVDPHSFGCALATVDGEVHGIGAFEEPFSVQSISKLFPLALVLAGGEVDPWGRVGRRPSGDPFNSVAQLEFDRGIPHNPFVNAGALVVTDQLLTQTGDAVAAVCDFVRVEAGDPSIDSDPLVAASEAANSHRNAALAHLLASYGNLHNDVDAVLDHYIRQCAIRMSCRDIALSAGVLARHGTRRDGSRMISRSDAKRMNAVTLMCGPYEGAGELAYRVGLPSKSGIGGGVLAIVPGRSVLCAWSPGLDESGNSVAAVEALDVFSTISGWSIF